VNRALDDGSIFGLSATLWSSIMEFDAGVASIYWITLGEFARFPSSAHKRLQISSSEKIDTVKKCEELLV